MSVFWTWGSISKNDELGHSYLECTKLWKTQNELTQTLSEKEIKKRKATNPPNIYCERTGIEDSFDFYTDGFYVTVRRLLGVGHNSAYKHRELIAVEYRP